MSPKALDGLVVLDFTQLLQGPFCTQLLADMGATIIKVERPRDGDLFRSMTFNDSWLGGHQSPNFLAWNRNKRSIAIDLKSSAGKSVVYRLAAKADVAVQNFRPGVMGRLGYGYEDLKKVNDRIIYCSGSGFGESGPYVTRPGQDLLVQGLAGITTATGPGTGAPIPVGTGFADQVGAMNMVYGILSALYWRERSGQGQEVQVDLLSGMLAHQGQELLMSINLDQDLVRAKSGIASPGMEAPYGVYPSSDGWITIAMSPLDRLVTALGDDSLLAYQQSKDLFTKRDEVWEKIASITRERTSADLLEALLAQDVWCGEIKNHRQVARDPQVQHLGLIQTIEHPTAGTLKFVGPAVRMSKTPPSVDRPPPLVGQHTREILAEAGYSDAEINGLFQSGAIGEQPAPPQA